MAKARKRRRSRKGRKSSSCVCTKVSIFGKKRTVCKGKRGKLRFKKR